MDAIDVKVFSLIAGVTMAIIGGVKKLFPAWVNGKEEVLAKAIPLLGVIIAKFAGAFHGNSWMDAMLLALGAGIASELGHDYVLDPVVKGLSSKSDGADK